MIMLIPGLFFIAALIGCFMVALKAIARKPSDGHDKFYRWIAITIALLATGWVIKNWGGPFFFTPGNNSGNGNWQQMFLFYMPLCALIILPVLLVLHTVLDKKEPK